MKSILILVTVMFLTACGTTYKIPDNNSGDLPWSTSYQIEDSDIEENTPYDDIEKVKFVVLLVGSNHDNSKYKTFMNAAVESMGFKKIYSNTEFARLIIDNGLDEKIGSTYDLVSLHKLYKELGEFLVISTSSNFLGSAWWEMRLVVTDPKSSEILLKARKRSTVWSNLDTEFSYPMINLLFDWMNSSVVTESPNKKIQPDA